jgi:hypothetical protein
MRGNGFGFALCVVLSTAMTTAALANDAAKLSDADRSEQIKSEAGEFLNHYIETLESRDLESVRGLFVNDERFAWYTDGALSYATPDALLSVLAGMQRYGSFEFKTTVFDVRVIPLSETMASVRTRFQTKLSNRGEIVHEYGGVITLLLEKSPQPGTWKVILGHTSTPGGPPESDDHKNQRDDSPPGPDVLQPAPDRK